ncbi:Do family serine endopeptidase [Planctomicrobium piriforme]|uniref:Serine protease Do n=1 Tax=Planctomicrobium piriforme TaxID=1576369 RepID=A0A1I3HHG8_9PLAN|nr:Do family serine endopeptidase [Planctomicrobium piriforme]SFI35185.1 serine protease Do [Planctomicrobium piriforme]
MKVRNNLALLLTTAGGICLGAAAVGVSQPAPPNPALAPAPAHSPEDLSIAFRQVSQRVLPAVVSISTQSKPAQITQAPSGGSRNGSRPEERMFREFFGEDPRFEQFFQQGGPQAAPPQQGAGSGFIVDPKGIILTNSHVVEGADVVTVKLQDGREIQAESWNFDPRSDVAIVRIKSDETLPSLTLGDSNQMQIGDWVLALGNPFNVGTTVTSGIISATGRGPGINEREQYLQTDAAINPGNSGGPLINLYGEVVGINTAISSRSGGYDGIGFAIPSQNVRWVAEQLIAHGEVKRSYLGVQLQELTNELRSQFNVPVGKGALVLEVLADTPAEKAKLQPGDIVLDFNGRTVVDRDDLVDAVERSAPNKTYDMHVLRDGKEVTVAVKLESMPGDYTAALRRARVNDKPTEQAKPDNQEISKLGLEVSELNGELSEQLGLEKDAKGVVVRNVKGSSPAAEAGLQSGDLIQRVGTTIVKSTAEFRDAVNSADLGKGLLLHIKRGKNSAFIVVKNVK